MKAEELLMTWDPLQYGVGSYGPEFDDILIALAHVDTIEELDRVIRTVFNEAFAQCPSERETHEMAIKLLSASSSCEL